MKLTDKQMEFARLLVEGRLSKPDAYRKAFAKNDMKDATASKAASRLSKNVEVCRYMDKLHAQLDKSSIMSKQERMEWLSKIIRTPIGKVDVDSDLCQELDPDSGKVKMPSKIQAIQELNKMDGAYTPDVVQVEAGDELMEIIKGISSAPLVNR